MLIKMISTQSGSRDGHTADTFAAGRTYNLQGEHGTATAMAFVQRGWAEEIVENQDNSDLVPGPVENEVPSPKTLSPARRGALGKYVESRTRTG